MGKICYGTMKRFPFFRGTLEAKTTRDNESGVQLKRCQNTILRGGGGGRKRVRTTAKRNRYGIVGLIRDGFDVLRAFVSREFRSIYVHAKPSFLLPARSGVPFTTLIPDNARRRLRAKSMDSPDVAFSPTGMFRSRRPLGHRSGTRDYPTQRPVP